MASSGFPNSPPGSVHYGNSQSHHSYQGVGRSRNDRSSDSNQFVGRGRNDRSSDPCQGSVHYANSQSDYQKQGVGRSRNYQSPDANEGSVHYANSQSDYQKKWGGPGRSYPSSDSNQWNSHGWNAQYYSPNQSRSRGRSYPYPDTNQYRQDQNYPNREKKMDDTSISRGLSNILRHSAEKLHLEMDSCGYIFVNDILKLSRFYLVTPEDIKRIVKENDKQRFSLTTEESSGKLKIRANQGHSLNLESLNLGFLPVKDPVNFPCVLHGTYINAWPSIEKEGLKKMKRAYIHFAAGLPGQNGVISGMRSSCEILIYIDLEKALKDGLEFFMSANKVILSKGNENGIIDPQYFSKVINWYTGKVIYGKDNNPKKNIPIGMSDPDKNQAEDIERRSKKSKKKDYKAKKSAGKQLQAREEEKKRKKRKKRNKRNKKSKFFH